MYKIINVLIVLLSLLVMVNSLKLKDEEYKKAFTEWTHKYQKQYESKEFLHRFGTFKDNVDFIKKWNSKNSDTVLALNHLADLSHDEYKKFHLGTNVKKIDFGKKGTHVSGEGKSIFEGSATVDWRTKGAVTPIKDQGQCGSCWAFSTTGSCEGAHQIKTGKLVSLSEQNLVDCSAKQGNNGCNGGLMNNAFDYIISNKGIDTEPSYPYTAETGTVCKYNNSNTGATISSYKTITAGSEEDLEDAAKIGPVSVAIDASHRSFQLYSHGIYYEWLCSSSRLDHGVLVVGYGSGNPSETATADNHKPELRLQANYHQNFNNKNSAVKVDAPTKSKNYWIVKNSWSDQWGDKGYIYMSKDRHNNCGIASCASYPIV